MLAATRVVQGEIKNKRLIALVFHITSASNLYTFLHDFPSNSHICFQFSKPFTKSPLVILLCLGTDLRFYDLCKVLQADKRLPRKYIFEDREKPEFAGCQVGIVGEVVENRRSLLNQEGQGDLSFVGGSAVERELVLLRCQ